MRLTIKQGKHRAFRLPKLWIGTKEIRRSVVFLPSCKYDLKDADQADTNKLFGIGYLWSHHKDSARFGWRYDNAQNRIVVSAYCYVNGKRIIKDITTCRLNTRYLFTLEIYPDCYEFVVKPELEDMYLPICERIDKDQSKMIGYGLGFYFGGNRTAPHDITIEIKKAKKE
jgi:hypothetical protein